MLEISNFDEAITVALNKLKLSGYAEAEIITPMSNAKGGMFPYKYISSFENGTKNLNILFYKYVVSGETVYHISVSGKNSIVESRLIETIQVLDYKWTVSAASSFMLDWKKLRSNILTQN
jgi:hypothetical protein